MMRKCVTNGVNFKCTTERVVFQKELPKTTQICYKIVQKKCHKEGTEDALHVEVFFNSPHIVVGAGSKMTHTTRQDRK
jgi:hypothetical protein